MTWPQRALVIVVVASALIVVTGAVPTSLRSSTGPSALLWGAFALNLLLLLVLGPAALITTRLWFRQGLPFAQLRRNRRGVRRRAVLLGLVAYVAHQTLVVLLDPRFSLEVLIGRRRSFGPVVTLADRFELAWAFTALALGYVIFAWLFWRSARVPDVVPNDTQPAGLLPVLDMPRPPLVMSRADGIEIEALPRNPVTGRVVRQFDV